jgi:hypothetical protein
MILAVVFLDPSLRCDDDEGGGGGDGDDGDISSSFQV